MLSNYHHCMPVYFPQVLRQHSDTTIHKVTVDDALSSYIDFLDVCIGDRSIDNIGVDYVCIDYVSIANTGVADIGVGDHRLDEVAIV